MHKNVLQHIDHVAVWPVISFVIFFLFFIGLLWWVFTADKGFIAKMKSLPGDDGTIHNREAGPAGSSASPGSGLTAGEKA